MVDREPVVTAEQVTSWLQYVHAHAIEAGIPGIVNLSTPVPHKDTTGPTWRSMCFKLDDLVEAGVASSKASRDELNLYYRVHLLEAIVPEHKRGLSSETRWITHLAADVDIAGPGHTPPKGTALPTFEEAVKLIDDTLPPSAIIASGGGLYPVWRLAEPFEITGDDDRARFESITRRLDAELGGNGFHVDSTMKDLARVIRPPGTDNRKPDRDVRPVTILRAPADGAGDFTLEEIKARLVELEARRPPIPAKPIRPKSTYTGTVNGRSAPDIFMDRYNVDDVLAADPGRNWESVGTRGGMDAWRYVGSSSDYSIKQSDTTGAIIVWSGTIAPTVDVEPGGAVDLWGLACRLADLDPTTAALGNKATGGSGRLVTMIEECALESFDQWKKDRDDRAIDNAGTKASNPTERTPKAGVPASWSDAHVGEAFGDTIAGRWLHCRALGGWHRWDGRRWIVDPGETVHEEFRQWIIALGERLWRDSAGGDAIKQIAKYRERGKIDAAVTIARRLENIAAAPDEFDRHPHLLNVENGVIDLDTGALLAHDPALRLTKLAAAAYLPSATHNDVTTILDALDPDVRPYVQRLFGSAAYGHVVDDVLAVFDGTGANGKTTILKAAATALGEYAAPASTRLLMARGVSDEHPTLLADLFGRRLVYIEETPEGGALRMEQVKNITGGGTLKARFIGKDYFSFEPSHQIIVATNHRPAVNASDYAAWRRLRLVPFTRTYRLPHEAQPGDLIADRGLRTRLGERAQREAILAWIVAGAVAWHNEGGLGPCELVDQATSTWRRDEDVIHAWWADRLEPGGVTPAAELYRSFTDWCSAEGRRYVSSNKEFAKKLTDHDLYREHRISKKITAIGAAYFGVSVVDVVGSTPGSHGASLGNRPTHPPQPPLPAVMQTASASDLTVCFTPTCPERPDAKGVCWVHGAPPTRTAERRDAGDALLSVEGTKEDEGYGLF